jgi:hypothetical protein
MRHNTQFCSSFPFNPASIRRLLVASAAVALLTMSGCGGDSSTSTTQRSVPVSVSDPTASEATPGTDAAADATPTTDAAADASSDADAGDGCRLLTSAEAEVALGTPVMPGVATSSDTPGYGSGFSCSYSANQSAGPTTARVSVLGTGFPTAEWQQAQLADGMTPVDGLGDVAFVDENNGKMDVLVDGAWLQAQLINVDEATLVSALTEICERAIERL